MISYNSTDLMPRVYEAMFQMVKRARYFHLPLNEYVLYMPKDIRVQMIDFISERFKSYIDPLDENVSFYGVKIVGFDENTIVLTHPKRAEVRGWPFILLEDIGTPYMQIKVIGNDEDVKIYWTAKYPDLSKKMIINGRLGKLEE